MVDLDQEKFWVCINNPLSCHFQGSPMKLLVLDFLSRKPSLKMLLLIISILQKMKGIDPIGFQVQIGMSRPCVHWLQTSIYYHNYNSVGQNKSPTLSVVHFH